jgi:hypothetical protein
MSEYQVKFELTDSEPAAHATRAGGCPRRLLDRYEYQPAWQLRLEIECLEIEYCLRGTVKA